MYIYNNKLHNVKTTYVYRGPVMFSYLASGSFMFVKIGLARPFMHPDQIFCYSKDSGSIAFLTAQEYTLHVNTKDILTWKTRKQHLQGIERKA